MAAPVYTTAQLTALVMQLQRQVVKLTKLIRTHVVDDDSGSFQSKVTSISGGLGSVSGNWSSQMSESWNIYDKITSGTGSASISIPEEEGLPGA